jgi:pimeloyl-ACP methyl ester carboxylesterase
MDGMKHTTRRVCTALLVLAVALLGAVHAIARREADGDNGSMIPRGVENVDDFHSVSYLHAGEPEAPRIIFVHGTPGSAGAWAAYLENPVDGFESIAIDRFGFGRSKPKTPTPSLEEQAKAVEPFLIPRNGRWPILVGHSLGAPIIARAATDYPGRVGGLVFVSGAMDPKLEKVYWYQRVGEFWFVPRLLPELLRNSNRELIPLKGELEKLEPLLEKIDCPIAIIHGRKDWLVPVANVEYMKERLPKEHVRQVSVLDEGDHFLIWNSEAVIREAILGL